MKTRMTHERLRKIGGWLAEVKRLSANRPGTARRILQQLSEELLEELKAERQRLGKERKRIHRGSHGDKDG